jgi:hypothetical protein
MTKLIRSFASVWLYCVRQARFPHFDLLEAEEESFYFYESKHFVILTEVVVGKFIFFRMKNRAELCLEV